MSVKFILFFAYLVFASFVLYGEIGLNSYGIHQGALNRILKDEKAQLDSVMSTPIIRQRLYSDSIRISALTNNSESQNIINKDAVNKKRDRINPFSGEIRANDANVAEIQDSQANFIAKQQEPILAVSKEKKELAQTTANSISLGIAMPCLAVFLCLFSAWLVPAGTRLNRNYGLLGSFLAQGVSSIITFDAVFMQQGQWHKAFFFSFGAFICLPLGHWMAGQVWREIQKEWKEYRFSCLRKKMLKNGDISSSMAGKSTVTMQTTTTTQEHKITLGMIPNDWVKAIQLVAKERQLGNGSGLGAMVAQKFGKSEAWVSQSVKRLLKNGQLV